MAPVQVSVPAKEPSAPIFGDTAVELVRQKLDEAADRVIEHRVQEGLRGVCPTCGRRPRVLTPGHVYFLIGFVALIILGVIGTVGK